MPQFLTDTTVLSNFAQVSRPDLLREVFPALAAPAVVREELAFGERLGLVPAVDWSWLETLELTDVERTQAEGFLDRLQAGEAACLAVAVSRGGLLLTDDSSARRIAASLHVEISGTIGVLDRLVRRQGITLNEADDLLAKMVSAGYRSPIRSLREIGP